MGELEEIRYPWINAAEFWVGGYWHQIEAMHLLLGWLFIVWLALRAFWTRDAPFEFRMATLYFALTVYTNFAYNVAGLNINDWFGIMAILIVMAKGRLSHAKSASRAAKGLFLLSAVTIAHTFVAALIYPELLPDMITVVTKMAVNFKIFVLAANLVIVGGCIACGVGLDRLIKACVYAGVIAQLMYLLQMLVASTGTLPYGTFLDAGFVGVPSFASVSIERGHMGKFIAPYFAFFLYAFVVWKWRWRFALFLLASAINFSASGQVFFACSLVIAIMVFRGSLGVKAYSLIAFGVAGVTALVATYWVVFEAIIDKIVTIAIHGDESQGGGRSFGLFIEYISTYPLGMGYSGSTLRTAPNLPEINAAHFAFISQYSFLAIPILLGYAVLLISVIRSGVQCGALGRCMVVGAAISPIMFFVDILWFVPLVWLPIEVILSVRRNWQNIKPSQSSPIRPAYARPFRRT